MSGVVFSDHEQMWAAMETCEAGCYALGMALGGAWWEADECYHDPQRPPSCAPTLVEHTVQRCRERREGIAVIQRSLMASPWRSA